MEYKVGMKVRMLQRYHGLGEGDVVEVTDVDRSDEDKPIEVSDKKGDVWWPFPDMFKVIEDAPSDTMSLDDLRTALISCINAKAWKAARAVIDAMEAQQ